MTKSDQPGPTLPQATLHPGVIAPQNRSSLPGFVSIVLVAAVIYVAREVFLPISVAMLIAFALSPMVLALWRRGVPQLISVLIVATVAFAAMALFFLVVAGQMTTLAQNLPTFQANILAKVDSFQAASGGDGIISRLYNMISVISADLGQALPAAPDAASTGTETNTVADPMRVELVNGSGTVMLLKTVLEALFTPIVRLALVVVLVIFMLLEREELRDKFIRLVGSNDLHRSTQILAEAGQRVGQYLLTLLLVNVIYALPIGIGLWLIGVPNAILWGILTLILRFVPYIGAILAAVFPLFLAFAVSPDWSAVLWTIALFATVEAVTSNIIEPWLYGSRTGLSPLAVIVAAIFWTWIWGPIGLVLSTPLTVCLVVLGRHIPQFELFNLLFGGEPVFAPFARLYQRLLAGDVMDVTLRAEKALETAFLADYYQQVGIPALLLAQHDYGRGIVSFDQQLRLAGFARHLLDELETIVQDERDEFDAIAADDSEATGHPGLRVACIGGRSQIDDVAAEMLAQSLTANGAETRAYQHSDLAPTRIEALEVASVDCLILNFLDPAPSRASLLHIRRLKRAAPGLRVGVVIWQLPEDLADDFDSGSGPATVASDKLTEAAEIGADFAVTDMQSALQAAFVRSPPVPLPDSTGKRPARKSRAGLSSVTG